MSLGAVSNIGSLASSSKNSPRSCKVVNDKSINNHENTHNADQSSILDISDLLQNTSAHTSDASVINTSIFPKAVQSSPLKIYSSPFVRRLDENTSKHQQTYRKFSLISLKSLLSELKEIDQSFFKSLTFVGVFANDIFVQHQTNLIKIDKESFLFNVFYQKILKEFGNFESIELQHAVETGVHEDLWELLREYFGVHIENKQIIAVPKLYDIVPEDESGLGDNNGSGFAGCFGELTVEKTDEVGTIKSIAQGVAKIYA
ncbi:uncharacterized protein VICG_02193, partial [Vittaforma corneae ATCC 50505]